MTFDVLQRLLWAGLGVAVAVLLALAVCPLRGLHPGLKVWACRLAMLKPLVACVAAIEVSLAASGAPGRVPPFVAEYLLFVWAVGAVFVLWNAGRGYQMARRLEQSGSPYEQPELISRVRTRSVAGLSEPCLVGVLRPKLLVPAGRPLDPQIVQHELSHLRHLDPLFGFVAWIVYAVFWFVPGLGRLVAEHALWQEVWADLDARRALGTPPAAQARLLLAAASSSPPVASPLIGFRGQARVVARRVEAMFVGRHSGLAAVLALVLTLAVAIPLRPAEAKPPSGRFVSPASLRSPVFSPGVAR